MPRPAEHRPTFGAIAVQLVVLVVLAAELALGLARATRVPHDAH
jgi:hypothetical protein